MHIKLNHFKIITISLSILRFIYKYDLNVSKYDYDSNKCLMKSIASTSSLNVFLIPNIEPILSNPIKVYIYDYYNQPIQLQLLILLILSTYNQGCMRICKLLNSIKLQSYVSKIYFGYLFCGALQTDDNLITK